MDSEIRTVSSVRGNDTFRGRVAAWVLLKGDRKVIAGGLIVGIVCIVGVLISVDVLAIGPGSSAATLFGSGLTSGVVTLVTVALSINQLILSRVFGTPDVLVDRLEEARNLRQNVEELAEKSSSPTSPAGFLSMIAATLSDRVSNLLTMDDSTDWQPSAETTDALQDLVDYGRSIDDSLDEDTSVNDTLGVVLGPEYALNMTAIHHLRNEHADSLSEDVQTELQAIDELLESIAIVRQFYKTIVLQQDFASASRLLVYTGILALLSTISLTLIYRTGSVTLPQSILPVVVSLGIGIIVSPLALFGAYILRAATIARQTVSVGPFVPPDER